MSNANFIIEKIQRLGGVIDEGRVSFPSGFSIKSKGDAIDTLDVLLFIFQAAKSIDFVEPLAALREAIESGAVAQ